MRVGLLTTSYPRYPGDYRGIFVKNLTDALRAGGVEVDVIEPPGYDVLKRGAGLIPNLRTSLLAKLAFPFYVAHFLLIALAKARHCDLFHANWSLSGLVAVIAGKFTGRRILLTERSPLLINTSNRWLNRATGWVMRRCDRVVTISAAAREALERKFPDLDVGVVPNGVDVELFAPAGANTEVDDRMIVTVGRVTAVKRLDVLLAALAALAGKGIDARACVVGDGEARGALEDEIARDGKLSGNVTFTGAKPQNEVAQWMQRSGIFVLCSEAESGGNVILEAMSTGLAVVSTPVGWAEEFIEDGTNGFLVPVGDAAALEQTLERLIEDAGLRHRLRHAARETILERRMSWSGCADRYRNEYDKLAAPGAAHA